MVARMVQRGPRVELVLQTPDGRELRRTLPWLRRADGALARLAAAGRLSELSVILAALLAESNPRQRPPRPPGDAGARGEVKADRTSADRAASSQAPTVAQNATGRRTAALDSAAPTSPADRVSTGDLPVTGGFPVTDEPGAPDPRTTRPVARIAMSPSGTAIARSPSGTAIARSPSGTAIAKSPSGTAITKTARASETPAVRRASDSRGTRSIATAAAGIWSNLALGAHAAGRFRASEVWSAEVGGGLRWRSVFVRAGYQAPASWSLEGRPIEVSAVPIALGWQPRLLGRGRLRLAGLVALVSERLTVRRLDLPGAATHDFWELGGAVGAAGLLRLSSGLELGLQLEASVMPAAREVAIPQGPSARLDRFGVQTVLALWWGVAGG